ncbi:short-chain dehydrogenase [Lophiostoma macrostomum CBS 122681]|uniref:Short-chain dehydrogenase n=1 Tax=Lophiostoma macrostomum CBS 122681 TaxID=1314788 RepID=A0A6A6TQY3_9PLEO|nr:short-chain dehydrogenase [Lophiostoma macrostomum CBS 122681]
MATLTLDPPPPVRALRIQEQDLKGKVALVTGATKGIGRGIAIELATRGASILGTYTSPSSAHLFDTLSHSISSLYADPSTSTSHTPNPSAPKLIGIPADITSPEAPSTILSALTTHFSGHLDIVILNAAVMGLANMGSGDVTPEFVSKGLMGNLQFPILLMDDLVKHECIRPDGRVIAISSEGVRAKRPWGGAVYAATKAGLECLMRQFADELGTKPFMRGTTFNSVSVGFTKTEAYANIPPTIRDQLTAADAAAVAVGNRIGEVEDIAGVVGLLVSEKARWISGAVVDGSGGKAKIM